MAIEVAAEDPQRKRIMVHVGTYRPQQPARAMIWLNQRHDGITLVAEGEVILTAANPRIVDSSAPSYPAVVNHDVCFGDGISCKTVLRGFKITGANGFLTALDEPVNIQPEIQAPLLHGSGAEIINCLSVGKLSNGPMDKRAETPGRWKPNHGSGALTWFPGSHVLVRRCTFTGNRNGVDDSNHGNIYEDSIFWRNNAPGGWPSGARYELDLASGVGVNGCFVGGEINDLRKNLDNDTNVVGCSDPKFDDDYVPQAKGFEGVGYRPFFATP